MKNSTDTTELNTKATALAFGKFAEDRAFDHYVSKGYAVLERNWRIGRIEIDLIAQMGNTIVFVEVKARSGRDMEPFDAVSIDKMKRMTRGADAFLKRMQGDYEYRYDLFGLKGDMNDFKVEVLEDAFISPLLR